MKCIIDYPADHPFSLANLPYGSFYTDDEPLTRRCGVAIGDFILDLQALSLTRYFPIAYHGRSSSIVVSGTPIRRPVGQILDKVGDVRPIVAPCRRLDFELEVGFFYGGRGTQLGERLSAGQAADRVFGAVLLNDWSARDIQTWEYVPLGPFLSKNFATTISPWIIPVHALEPFTCPGYTHDPPLLPYLRDADNTNFDVPLTVAIRPESTSDFEIISRSSLRHTYYTIRQMIAHHSTTGCPLRAGDLLGTGTISAPGEEGYGSLLEKSWMGQRPFLLGGGEERTFLEDGDTVRMSGMVVVVGEGGYSVGFGECVGTVLPALPL